MTDATCFLVPPEPDQPSDHSRKVECRALVQVPAPGGPPRIALTRELAEKICDLVAGGKTIRKIGDMEGLPGRATIRRWIAENEEFRRVTRSRRRAWSRTSWKRSTRSLTTPPKIMGSRRGTPVVREKKETIARATLRIATKFKLIGKVAPHKYGDVPPAWHRQLHPSSRAKAPAPRSWTVKSSRSSSTSVRLGGLAQGGEGSEMKHGQGTSRPSLFDGQGSSWT